MTDPRPARIDTMRLGQLLQVREMANVRGGPDSDTPQDFRVADGALNRMRTMMAVALDESLPPIQREGSVNITEDEYLALTRMGICASLSTVDRGYFDFSVYDAMMRELCNAVGRDGNAEWPQQGSKR